MGIKDHTKGQLLDELAVMRQRIVALEQKETKRKKTEKALKESEEKIKSFFDASPAGLAIFDNQLRYVRVNETLAQINGVPVENHLGKTLKEVLPKLAPTIEPLFRSILETGEPVLNLEVSGETPKEPGVSRQWIISYFPIMGSDGKVKAMGAVVIDTTDRMRAEEKLKESEERYRLLSEVAFDGIVLTEKGIILEANKEFVKIFGYAPSEIIGMHVSKLIAPELHDYVMEKIKSGYDKPYESICLKKDGTRFPVEVYGKNFSYNERTLRITAIRDIAGRKKLEEELQKSQKLESIGVLAGGIAHDFNNLLTAIMNNVYLSMKYVDRDSKALNRLEAAEKAILRARDLTQQLLTFSKGGAPVKRATNIIEVIKDSAEFALRGSNVKCIFNAANNLWTVEIDAGQISQVIHNLVINAEQSMPGGGVIQIRAENSVVNSDKEVLLCAGRYVKVSIQDQGMGIPEEHLQKVFDPYFSSKEMGRGLGLAVAYSIIKNHDGSLLAESEMNRGSTFTLYLPISDKSVEESGVTENEPILGKGRILIMDDEEGVRTSVGEILKELGYEVDYAEDGLEAIEDYRKAKESIHPFDVVILDLTVPGGMGGKEAVKKIRETDPEVKAIISSGYSNDPVMANFRDYGFDAVISKPYNIVDLSKVLHNVIKNKND